MERERLIKSAIRTNPTRIELELTERCNLSCKFCYNSQKPVDSPCVMDILERLDAEGVPEIILTGGEPILHPQFKEILRRSSAIFHKTMIQTNGTLIDDSIADLLSENGVYEVNISLHGPLKLHEVLTLREGSYDMAVGAIKRLVSRGMRVSSNFVMTRENVIGLRDNLAELYQLGVRCMTLTRFTPTGVGATNSQMVLSRGEIVEAIGLADQFSKAHPDVTILLGNSMPLCALPDSLSHYCEHCHFGASRFYIDVNGNVLMCGMSRVQLGNILQDTFSEIKSHSKEFVSHILGEDVPKQCLVCGHFRQCRGGCRAAALANTGDFRGADPYLVEESVL